jgi:hypothetical protein
MSTSEAGVGFRARARELYDLGFSVIPVNRDKVAEIEWKPYQSARASKEEMDRWIVDYPDCNIGVVTGRVSGIIVLDTDSNEADVMVRALCIPPGTPTVRTAKGHHYYFKYPTGFPVNNRVGVLPGVDIRTDGGYVVAPGSVHASGHVYEWEIAPSPSGYPPIPDRLLEAINRKSASPSNVNSCGKILRGARNDGLYRAGRRIHDKDLSPEAISAALLAENAARCEPPLPEHEVLAISRHVIEQPDQPDYRAEQRPKQDSPRTLYWARLQIQQYETKIREAITAIYELPYLEAAAVLHEDDHGEYERLVKNLKAKGARVTNWENDVRKTAAQLRQEHASQQGGGGSVATRESIATALVNIAQRKALFFHDGDDAFSAITIDSHTEIHALNSRAFKHWLSHQYFALNTSAPNTEALSTAITTLAGFARFKGEEKKTYNRVAEANGKYYLDLCDPCWRVIEIDSGGWCIIEAAQCPVFFRRAHGMEALPEPRRGGCVNCLRDSVNLPSDDDFRLVLSILVTAIRPHGPYPLLVLTGEHGTAKSTTQLRCRSLIDPNQAPLRSQPKEPRDLAITAKNSYVISLNNISKISPWLSDGLCCLSTGSGFATRALFTDEEEKIFAATRPVVVNSIDDVITRGDLLDRAVVIAAPPIANVRDEEQLDGEFRERQPRILGALLDAVSSAIRRYPRVKLEKLPRMADFAKWAAAAAPALGWSEERFLQAYAGNRRHSERALLEEPLAEAVSKLVLPFESTATVLLEELNKLAPDETRKKRELWPQSAKSLGSRLRRLAPALRRAGICDVRFERETATRKRERGCFLSVLPQDEGEKMSETSELCEGSENAAITCSFCGRFNPDELSGHSVGLPETSERSEQTSEQSDEKAQPNQTQSPSTGNADVSDIFSPMLNGGSEKNKGEGDPDFNDEEAHEI